MTMNREARRKTTQQVVTAIIKGRELALAKKQYGFGLVVTNLMVSIIFWRWTWTPIDRRAK